MSRVRIIPRLSETETDRFWAFVDKSGECWIWLGGNRRGYGHFKLRGTTYIATRVSWALANGRSPNLKICHTCDNPRCVNPTHLWEGSDLDNVRDAIAKGRRGPREFCGSGHAMTGDNVWGEGHTRRCRTCDRLRHANALPPLPPLAERSAYGMSPSDQHSQERND